MLIQTAIELKNEYTGKASPPRPGILGLKRNEFWTSHPVRRLISLFINLQLTYENKYYSGKMR
jgi:hypothetical protein